MLLHLQTSNITVHAASAADGDDDELPITPERMVGWRSVKSLRNRLDKGYLFMTKDYITLHAAAADSNADDLPITPERMVGWRRVKSLRNRLHKGYLFMTKDDRFSARFVGPYLLNR